jgi:hypothetical protein
VITKRKNPVAQLLTVVATLWMGGDNFTIARSKEVGTAFTFVFICIYLITSPCEHLLQVWLKSLEGPDDLKSFSLSVESVIPENRSRGTNRTL